MFCKIVASSFDIFYLTELRTVVLSKAALEAEEDQSSCEDVEEECEADAKGGEEDRTNRVSAAKNGIFKWEQVISNFSGIIVDICKLSAQLGHYGQVIFKLWQLWRYI